MMNSLRSWGYALFSLVVIFVIGCSPDQLPEEEPIPQKQAEPTIVEPTDTVDVGEPSQSESAAYPAPTAEKERPDGYPEPAVLVQATAYPEPRAELPAQAPPATLMTLNVINSFPHNSQVFTQGLVWADRTFYESGGLYGESALYRVSLEGGTLQQAAIDAELFAEGIALVDDRIIMLTWQKQVALVFDKDTFEEIGRFDYTGQGWGLCYDESNGRLWMSDGSQRIVSRDPVTFDVTGEILVTLNSAPLTQINELECVDGTIYANLWKSDKIMGINSGTGNVEFEVDASGLLTAAEQATLVPGRHVLNGIAYDGETDRFYLTGKNWPRMFEVEFVESE